MYLEIYNAADGGEGVCPAGAAVDGIAKLHGLGLDRQQIEAVIRKLSFDPNADATMSERNGSNGSGRRFTAPKAAGMIGGGEQRRGGPDTRRHPFGQIKVPAPPVHRY